MEHLIILAVVFFAFIGLAHKDVIQMFLAGTWALMAIGTIVSMLYLAFFR